MGHSPNLNKQVISKGKFKNKILTKAISKEKTAILSQKEEESVEMKSFAK